MSPAVVEQWRDGRVLEGGFPPRRPSVVHGQTRTLLPEEKALLTLLRSWRIRRVRAA